MSKQPLLLGGCLGSDEVFCKSVEDQPGREHTHTRAHTTHHASSATDRPLSLFTPPQLSQFTKLCHRTSPASPSPPPAPCAVFPPPADLLDGSSAGSRKTSRKLPPRMFLLPFRPDCSKLLRLPSRSQRSAEPIFSSLRAPEAIHGGWLLRARSSQISTRTAIRTATASVIKNPVRKCDKDG